MNSVCPRVELEVVASHNPGCQAVTPREHFEFGFIEAFLGPHFGGVGESHAAERRDCCGMILPPAGQKQLGWNRRAVVPQTSMKSRQEGALPIAPVTVEDEQGVVANFANDRTADRPLDIAMEQIVTLADAIEERDPTGSGNAWVVSDRSLLSHQILRAVFSEFTRAEIDDTVLDVQQPGVLVELLGADREVALSDTEYVK